MAHRKKEVVFSLRLPDVNQAALSDGLAHSMEKAQTAIIFQPPISSWPLEAESCFNTVLTGFKAFR